MSSSGSGEMTIYGGVKWTLAATADSSPNKQTLTVYLDDTEVCVFEGSGGNAMTVLGTGSTKEVIPAALKFRKLSWTLNTETTEAISIKAAFARHPLKSGPLVATPGQPEYPDNPYFFELPANTTVQLTAICSTDMQQYIEYGVVTLPSKTFFGRKRDTAMTLLNSNGATSATSATVGPYTTDTTIVALFTYRRWIRSVDLSISSVGNAVTAGKDVILTTIPSRNTMLINAVPPWFPLPIPVSTSTAAHPEGPELPLGHVTVGKPHEEENLPGHPPVLKAPDVGELFHGNPHRFNYWWFLPRQYSGVGSLLNIAKKA